MMAAPLRHPQRQADPRAPLSLPDDKQPGTRLGCRYSPEHHLHWYWSDEGQAASRGVRDAGGKDEAILMANSRDLIAPTYCPVCFHPFAEVTGHDAGLVPVGAQLVRVASLLAREGSRTARDLSFALDLARNTVSALLRRAEAAGLVTHTTEITPHVGGRRFVYSATPLLRAYAPDVFSH